MFRYNGEDVRLMIWDTAGQEEFDAITKAYYRGNILFLCFSIIYRFTNFGFLCKIEILFIYHYFSVNDNHQILLTNHH